MFAGPQMWEGVEVSHLKDVNIDNESEDRLSCPPSLVKAKFCQEQQARKLSSPLSLNMLLQILQYK